MRKPVMLFFGLLFIFSTAFASVTQFEDIPLRVISQDSLIYIVGAPCPDCVVDTYIILDPVTTPVAFDYAGVGTITYDENGNIRLIIPDTIDIDVSLDPHSGISTASVIHDQSRFTIYSGMDFTFNNYVVSGHQWAYRDKIPEFQPINPTTSPLNTVCNPGGTICCDSDCSVISAGTPGTISCGTGVGGLTFSGNSAKSGTGGCLPGQYSCLVCAHGTVLSACKAVHCDKTDVTGHLCHPGDDCGKYKP